MSRCSVRGCDCPANAKALDWRRRRATGAPAVLLVCDFHGQEYSHREGFSVKGITTRRGGPSGGEKIDLRAALRRLGKLPSSNGEA